MRGDVQTDEVSEMRVMRREHAGCIHKLRLQHLGRELERGPIAVRESSLGFCGDRARIVLNDGRQLRLKLLWPRRVAIAALCWVEWRDDIGWVVVVRSTAGDSKLLYAWVAELMPPELEHR